MSAGVHSFGSAIYVAPLSTPVPPAGVLDGNWVNVAEVTKISGVPIQSSVTDLTHLASPSKAKEKMAGMFDGGQCTFGVNVTKAGILHLVSLMPAGAAGGQTVSNLKWVVVISNIAVWYFEAFMQQIPIDIPEDAEVSMDVTLEISGLPTLVLTA